MYNAHTIAFSHLQDMYAFPRDGVCQYEACTEGTTVQVAGDRDYNEYVLGCYYGELNALRDLLQAAKVRVSDEASEFKSNKLAIDELQVDIAELEERLVAWGHDPKLSQAASVPVPLLP